MNVLELSGWESRGEGGAFTPRGILLHHDAMGLGYVNTNLADNLNVPNYMSQNGVAGSQLWVGRDTLARMTLVFLAAGLKWHAGAGRGFRSIPANQGNAYCIGIETDHTFGTGWDDDLRRYIDLTTWLLCDEFGIDPDQWMAGHREYAPDRKVDPESYDLDAWRTRARNRRDSGLVAPAPAPGQPGTPGKFFPRMMRWAA